MTRVALQIGDEAWCLLIKHSKSRSDSPGAGELLGAGRCRIVAIEGETYRATVLQTSKGEEFLVGLERDFDRSELYACVRIGLTPDELAEARREHNAFGEMIAAFWDRGARGDAARAARFGGRP